jgi:hypothetical protein
MSRNFTADVDTQREYYNAAYFNDSGQNQQAKYSTSLLKPLLKEPGNWKLAINRMRIPLSGIPLSKNNIPYQTWEVGLSYKKTSTGSTLTTDFEYVGQLDPPDISGNDAYVITNDFKIQRIDNQIQTQYKVISSDQLKNVRNQNGYVFVQPQFAMYNGKVNIFILNGDSNFLTVDVYDRRGNLLSSLTPDFIIANPATTRCAGIAVSSDGTKLFVLIDRGSTSVIVEYDRIDVDNWNYTFGHYYSLNGTVAPVNHVEHTGGIAYVNGNVYMGAYDAFLGWQVLYWPQGQYTSPQTVITTPAGSGNYGKSFFPAPQFSTNGTLLFILNNSAGNQQLCIISGSATIIDNVGGFTYQGDIASIGFSPSGLFLFHGALPGVQKGYYGASGPSVAFTITPPNGMLNFINSNIPYQEKSQAGPVDIFTYQTYLNQINAAFNKAFQNIKAVLASGFEPTQPPYIVYEATNKLFSLIVEGQYLTLNPDGSNRYEVLLNTPLQNQFYFPSTSVSYNSATYSSILMQNYGVNAVIGNGSASIPQFISITQEDSTIYAFYDLVRLLVETNRIPVSGDAEGKTFSNTGSVSNNSINIITDIVPDTTTLTPGTVLIYVPQGILRWYNMYAQQPLDNLDLAISYETKDGNIYPVNILSGEFFSVKLEFKKGPGDF